MQIVIKGHGVHVTDELQERVRKRFAKVEHQVADGARLEIELSLSNGSERDHREVVDVTLHLKGVSLRCREDAKEFAQALNHCSDDLSRQVKRHRDKRRHRRDLRTGAGALRPAL